MSMELIEQLKADGRAKGLCRMWQMKLKKGLPLPQLVGLYVRGIDFCISEDYPTLDFLRENFKGQCEPYGVYIDDVVEISNKPDTVLNGDCKAFLSYDGFAVGRAFIRHNSKAAVNVSGHAVLTIDIFDNSHVSVAVSGWDAKVDVNVYGRASVVCIGHGITVNKTNKNTY